MWTEIRNAQSGSQGALENLLTRYRSSILEFLRGRGLPEADAEDLTQAVLMEVAEKGFLEKADRSKGRFRSLLMRVAQHLMQSHFRARYARKREGDRTALPFEEIAETAMPKADEAAFNDAWARGLIDRALERLKSDSTRLRTAYHDALVLHYFEGWTYGRIAERLRCKETDVSNYLHLGKKRLRQHLEDLAEEYSSTPAEHREESELLARYLPSEREGGRPD